MLSSQKRGSGGASLTNHTTRYILLFSKFTAFPPPHSLASGTPVGPNMPALCPFLNLSVSGPPGVCQSHLQNKANSPGLLPRSKTQPFLTWTIPTAPLLISKLHHFAQPTPTTFSVLGKITTKIRSSMPQTNSFYHWNKNPINFPVLGRPSEVS